MAFDLYIPNETRMRFFKLTSDFRKLEGGFKYGEINGVGEAILARASEDGVPRCVREVHEDEGGNGREEGVDVDTDKEAPGQL